MGKSLIIKGADFSANAIVRNVWYSNKIDSFSEETATVFTSSAFYTTKADMQNIHGKPVNMLRIPKSAEAGDIFLYVIDTEEVAENVNIVKEMTINIPLVSDVTEIELPETIHLQAGQTIVMKTNPKFFRESTLETDDYATYKYNNNNNTVTTTGSNIYLLYDFGYKSSLDV